MSMHHLRGARALFAGAATAALLLGGALGASADPIDPDTEAPQFRAVNGTGSDTTQDLNNGLAAVVTGPNSTNLILGSYDATLPGGDDNWTQTSQCGTLIPRPNGSGQGVTALRAAKGSLQLTLPRDNVNYTSYEDTAPCGPDRGPEDTTTTALEPGDLQFARSSSGIAPSTTGAYSYIPLAVDAVTYAVHSSNTTIPRNLTSADLTDIYSANNNDLVTLSDGEEYRIGTETNAAADIVPFIPQSGSGTRSFWLSAVLDGATPGTAVTASFAGDDAVVEGVQEHDGAVLAEVDNAITPFSIAQHIAQGNAGALSVRYGVTVNDRRNGAVLANVDSESPYIDSDGDGDLDNVLNTEFPLARPVFTVVLNSEIAANANLRHAFWDDPATTGAGNTEGAVYTAKASPTSPFVIEDFGFGSIIDRDTEENGVTIDGLLYKAGDALAYRTN